MAGSSPSSSGSGTDSAMGSAPAVSPVRRPQDLKDRFKGLVKIHATDEEFFSNGEEWESS